MRRLSAPPRLLLGLCALFWAGNFVLARAMHETIPPIGFAFWRWTAASLLVLPFVWRPLRRQWALLRAHLGRMLVLAVLGVSGFNTLVYLGLQTTSVTNSVLIQSSVPLMILVFNRVLFATPLRARDILSVGLSLTGVLVIIGGGRATSFDLAPAAGDLWVLAAALTWALYSVLLRWRPAGLDGRAFLGFTLIAGTLCLLPVHLVEGIVGRSFHWDVPVVLSVAYVAIFPSALAYLFWNRGVEAIGANAAGQFAHLMPVFGSLMAVVFLGESFGWQHVAGGVLVASAIVLTLRKDP